MAQRIVEPDIPGSTKEPREIRLAEPPEPAARRRKRNRNITIGIVVVVLVVIVVALLRSRAAANAQQAQAASATARNRAVPVSVEPVVARDVPVYFDGLGNVNALNTVTVKTRIDGQRLRFNFQEGQVVHGGEGLLPLAPAP